MLIDFIANNLEIFARAGGGGSSGGGGGGGSAIAAIPFIIGYFVSSKFRLNRSLGYVVATIVCLILVIPLFMLSPFLALGFAFIYYVGVNLGLNTGIAKFLGKRKHALKEVEKACVKDSSWEKGKLINNAKNIFVKYQNDWQNFNFKSMSEYMETQYLNHAMLMMLAMKEMHRINKIEDINIKSALISDVKDVDGKEGDMYKVAFEASLNDKLIDVRTNSLLSKDTKPFAEQWTFIRHNDKWMLHGIKQATEDSSSCYKPMNDFADKHGMYFSPDWGNLLLPSDGVLFSKQGKRGLDINNHVIGYWDNKYIVQLYSYSYLKSGIFAGGDNRKYYTVGQISLPKSYGKILVKDNSIINNFIPFFHNPGYRRVETEWNDFNKKYRIYATKPDMAPTFELLNPSFMAWLYDTVSKNVFIEVVDNVVYVYVEDHNIDSKSYEVMMEVLKGVYRELKL